MPLNYGSKPAKICSKLIPLNKMKFVSNNTPATGTKIASINIFEKKEYE
jgi:hypothetical protein